MSTKARLGRGLEALIPKTALASGRTMLNVSVLDIDPNPFQPRTDFDVDALKTLAESIKTHGLTNPILVRRKGERYELIAGERRLRATEAAGLDKIPVIVKMVTDQESLELALIENEIRENLNVIDVAQSYSRLIHEFGLSHDDIGKVFGRSRSTITNTLRMLNLPDEVQALLKNGALSEGHGRALLSISDEEAFQKALDSIVARGLSVRDTEDFVSTLRPSKRVKGAKAAGKGNKRLQTEDYLDSIIRVSSKYDTSVEIKGTDRKGVVSFSYSSRGDLDRLLKLL